MKTYARIKQASLDPECAFRTLDFEDHYFSIIDPIGERQSVFIEGLDLPNRFRKLRPNELIRIGETGFGTGLTFLLAAHCFIQTAPKGARMQWTSSEHYPLNRSDLTRIHSKLPLNPVAASIAEKLRAYWPALIPGCHRRSFQQHRILLDLHFGDATDIFKHIVGSIDAWCLDGFAPSRNQALWSPQLFHSIASCSSENAPVSTYTSARSVKDGLSEAGFKVWKIEGFAGKRERIVAIYQGKKNERIFAPKQSSIPPEHVTIIGAGLAGAWVANGLAVRGIKVNVYEKQTAGSGASGNPQAITYAKLSIEATPSSLLQLQGLANFSAAISHLESLQFWHSQGFLILEGKKTEHQRKLLESLSLPNNVLTQISCSDASDLAGNRLASGGLHFQPGGWMNPRMCINQLLKHSNITVRAYHKIEAYRQVDQMHYLEIGTPLGNLVDYTNVIVWANALESNRHAAMSIPLVAVRGQITNIRANQTTHLPICGGAYLAPSDGEQATCGATYEPKSHDMTPRDTDNLENIARVNQLFADPQFNATQISGQRVSIRTATPDYAPAAGQMADASHWSTPLDRLRKDAKFIPPEPLPFIPGSYMLTGLGSRGTLTAPVTAEMVVSEIMGETLNLPDTVRSAISPDRFFRRALVRGN